MTRDANTPLVLWICAAICAHYMFAEGGDTVAKIHDDRVAIAELGEHVRERVRFSEQTFEVSSLDAPTPALAEPPPPPPEAPPPAPKPTATPVPSVKPPAPVEPPKPPAVKPPTKIAIKVVPEDPAKKLLEPPPQADKRIAVRQHVTPKQADNPNARFIGDEANHVDKETVATQTAHDQDDPNPTPGGNHAGPTTNMGDSDRTKIADSEEHAGEKNRAPGEKGTEFEVQHDPMPLRPQGAEALPGAAGPQPPMSGGDGRMAGAPTEPDPGGATASPNVMDGAGNWTFDPVRPGAGAGIGSTGGTGRKSGSSAASTTWLGLGGKAGPGQVNLNLNQNTVVASVGQDQLRREREADGERRRSEHRGTFIASSFERWRSAIENYVSSVKPGNQTALNTAHSPFATYLTTIHNRIHPIFADAFLDGLDALPRENPLNDQHLKTALEIVVTRDGHIVKMGVVKPSGVTAFDIAALDSVQRASPFGPAPTAIVSPDGRVYLHWEFWRNREIACSTMNARPFLLNVPAGAPPVDPTPTPTLPGRSLPHEPGPPAPANITETRQGMLEARRPDTEG